MAFNHIPHTNWKLFLIAASNIMRRAMKTLQIAILGGGGGGGGIPNKQGTSTTFVRDYRYDNGHHRGHG